MFNYYLDKKIKQYNIFGKNISLKEIKRDLVLLKKEYPFLNENDSMSLTNSLEELDTSFTNFFEKRGGYPKLKAKEEIIEKPFKLSNVVGMDLGIKDSIITSDGVKYKKLDISRIQKHIGDLHRKLSRCYKKIQIKT